MTYSASIVIPKFRQKLVIIRPSAQLKSTRKWPEELSVVVRVHNAGVCTLRFFRVAHLVNLHDSSTTGRLSVLVDFFLRYFVFDVKCCELTWPKETPRVLAFCFGLRQERFACLGLYQ